VVEGHRWQGETRRANQSGDRTANPRDVVEIHAWHDEVRQPGDGAAGSWDVLGGHGLHGGLAVRSAAGGYFCGFLLAAGA
jgi:hypothetical protein